MDLLVLLLVVLLVLCLVGGVWLSKFVFIAVVVILILLAFRLLGDGRRRV